MGRAQLTTKPCFWKGGLFKNCIARSARRTRCVCKRWPFRRVSQCLYRELLKRRKEIYHTKRRREAEHIARKATSQRKTHTTHNYRTKLSRPHKVTKPTLRIAYTEKLWYHCCFGTPGNLLEERGFLGAVEPGLAHQCARHE